MKTIKMLADELGVTKQTIVNNAKNLNISFEKENGINYINENDCLKIINKIAKKDSAVTNRNSKSKEIFEDNISELSNTETSYSINSDILKAKVNELEKQIEIFETRSKNDEKYIENLTKQLDQQNSNVNTLNKLLENQQILTLESNKKIQKLENQLEEERQLNYSFNTTTNDRKNVNEEGLNTGQKQEKNEQTNPEYKDIPEENKSEDIKQAITIEKNNRDKEQEAEPNNDVYQPSKKGFWRRLFGN